ncbi:bifunctional 4-hydroxy-2-oxoglutarate aldolase/2-dehydro-3-deoxy-phosphogluconate aldolase [Pseudactinotalea terrae]|uniref:bifunctional 4-hydroxy-2-oxoglutarate aldolase/2-dehydro-3-deoxy-phosphogluconate aldolase n=1 Tax=Pseudactinotalea terrae TaxID=1743262 RepID=UPI0012E2ED18|nr:bifunctional 4-hydroxy-2-oxoglutarate aldolase/2-dehydro-3-deoxy-phosphogluconate aldolase [Pseudactinotalea terrae]
MTADQTVAAIAEQGVVGIVRATTAEAGRTAARTFLDAGLAAVEVSLTTPGALETIAELTESGCAVGAGTVRTLAQARDAHAAGATFLVSPLLDLQVVRYAVENDLAALPGCLTPSEMTTAQRAGAQLVKIFPAHLWSPAALAGMLEAMPDLRCVPTGGVSAESGPEWVRAGAVAVGVGGSLTRAEDPRGAVADLLAAIQDARA